MEYRRFGDKIILRIEKGEEVLAVIRAVCEQENILLASVSGIGAVGDVILGVFNSERFEYETRQFVGDMEIVSCVGNVSTMNGETYLHLHMTVGNVTKGMVHAGHLSKAIISLTGEFILQIVDGQVDRKYSPEIGLNLIKF